MQYSHTKNHKYQIKRNTDSYCQKLLEGLPGIKYLHVKSCTTQKISKKYPNKYWP